MKVKVRNLLVSLTAVAMACTMSASVVCAEIARPNGQPVSAADGGLIDVTDELQGALDTSSMLDSNAVQAASVNVKSDGTRRVIVEMESDSLLENYLDSGEVQRSYADLSAYVNAAEGRTYAYALEREQNSFLKALNRSGIEYELRHSYTSVLNGVSLTIDDDDVDALAEIEGVANIIYSESYAIPAAEATMNEVEVYDTGIYDSSEISYQGDGILAAVLDTGFDRSHPAFQEMPEVQKLTKSDVASELPSLSAATHGESISVNDVYYNAKVPFAYDYADGDPDVFPKTSSHGLHVAGIIAGKDESVTAEDAEAFENGETFIGVAPNAQLMICKVFPDQEDGTEGGAETDDILAALSDCIALNVDVINMSLGVAAGFSREEDGNAINAVYDSIYEAGINLVVAASNDGSAAQNGAYGTTNLTSNPDSATVGSPSTYTSSLSVASISGQLSSYMQLEDGTAVYFNESSNAAGIHGDFVAELLDGRSEATFNFVVVPGYGYDYNYTADVQAKLDAGNCIAIVSRGENNFEDKQEIAAEHGAVGCIIYNNMSGRINASLGTGKMIPTCTVTADIGRSFVAAGSGTIYLNEDFKAGPFMSDFSSWGPAPDLKIKPEITAHGGEITSSVVGGYSIYSGTSMAAPNMAGAVALLRQHVSETYGLTGKALADRVNQLLMSTATIVNDERGLPYAVRKQGAGLGDIGKAIASDAYLSVENNSKPKLELGDDPEKRGVYTMEFDVNNTSSESKSFTLDAIVMTESVSIDGITVAEQSYMLEDAETLYYVSGELVADGKISVPANGSVTVTAVLSLSGKEKDYLDDNFENGMFVEGFITLDDADEEGVDLSIPYLAFYGDWLSSPVFDHTMYEVSADAHNSAIADEDKTISAVYESVAIGRYYRGTETYLPLGQYVYDTADAAESEIEASVDKIAVGNSDYGIYEFYAVYFGLLRSVDEMEVRVEDSVTGEVVWSNTLYTLGKSYSSTPSYAEIGISPYELNLQNNRQYTAVFDAKMYYNGRQSEVQTQEFTFTVDYETPFIYQSAIRYEYDSEDNTLRHAYLDLTLYDNHYVQAIQLFSYEQTDSNVDWATEETGEVDWLTPYSIAVDSSRGATTRVTVEITDYMDKFMTVDGQTGKYIGVRVDDYALNSAAYLVELEYPEVSKVDVEYTYYDDFGDTQTQSLAGSTVVMNAGTGIDLSEDSEDTGSVRVNGSLIDNVEFAIRVYNYATYACSAVDAHGITCGYVYDEHVGLTYSEGDYYYDAATGTVRQKTENDETATYPAGTSFLDIIATRTAAGDDYTTNHFVCPECGTEATFTYNRRSDTLTPENFSKTSSDPMADDVIWTSSDESIVRIENGRLYGVKAGTATITAYAPDAALYPYPMEGDPDAVLTFTVEVQGEGTPQLESITIGSYENLTLGTTRTVSGSSISVDNGSELILYPDFRPWYIDSLEGLSWSTSDPDVVEIISSDDTQARVLCKRQGMAEIMLMYSRYICTFTIVVGPEFTTMSTYCYEYNGPGYSEVYTDPVSGEQSNILVIPANLGITTLGYVIATQEGPFFEKQGLDTVIIPEGVTTLGLSCFENSSVRRVYLPSSLISVAYNAFRGCENLEGIYWYDAGEGSTSGIEYDADDNTYNWDVFFENVGTDMTSQSLVIGSNAFEGCVRLTDIDLDGVTGLYDFAFNGCVGITEADVSDVRFTGIGVFSGCTALEEVTLSANTELGAYMFSGSAIEEVVVEGSFVPAAAFAGMTSLERVVFANDLEYIGARALEGCTSLEEVTFMGSCASLSDYAFAGCTSLTSIELPAGLASVGNYAFQGCTSLKEVTLDGGTLLTSVGADIFRGCTSLGSITLSGESDYYQVVTNGEYGMLADMNGNAVLVPPAYPVAADEATVTVGTGMTYIGAQAYANNAALQGKTLVIADGVASIGNTAFAGTGITAVIIPASVTTLGEDVFAYCEDLTTVVFLGELTSIPAGTFRGCTSLVDVQIPESVTEIGASAFEGTALTSLTVGSNVRTIGESAFASCGYLTNVTFAAGSRLTAIGDYAFSGAQMSALTLPDSVESLGAYAFYGCTQLRSAYISASLEEMGDYAFAGCGLLGEVVFGEGAALVGNYAFVDLDGDELRPMRYLSSVTLPASVTSVGEYAFAGNTALKSIALPGVESIGSHAFYQTPALTAVELSSACSYIGISAFEGSAVEDIELKDVEYFDARSFYGTAIDNTDFSSAIEIGDEAFYSCTQIAGNVLLPNAVQIYSSAFYIPSNTASGTTQTGRITGVELGDELIGLGGGAFFNSSIRTIRLPASLEIIGEPAFAGYNNLSNIVVDGGNEVFFVDSRTGGLYKNLANGTYELVSVPNNLGSINEDYTFEILEGTSRVGAWAMAYCNKITHVVIPASVRTIGDAAFYYVGMAGVNNPGVAGAVANYPVYEFKGLTAPTIESGSLDQDTASVVDLYRNFTYQVGYLVSDMIIPVNATGFETVVYEFFFRNKTYSEELIEEGTQALLDWLNALDVEALTAEDAATVNQMNTNYNMMSDGQKSFIPEDALAKLNAAVEKIASLTGEDDPGPDPDTDPDPEPTEPSSNTGLIIGLSVGGGVIVIAAVAALVLLLRRKKRTESNSDSTDSTGSSNGTDNGEEE